MEDQISNHFNDPAKNIPPHKKYNLSSNPDQNFLCHHGKSFHLNIWLKTSICFESVANTDETFK